MPIGNVSGLSSGIDWNSTIDLIMQLERRPVDLLEIRRSEYQSRLTNWGAIESKLNALQSKAESLDSLDEFLAKSATTTDSDVLTVKATKVASPGSHDIIVNQLATNHTHAHTAGWADLNSTAVNNSGGDQTFSYTYDGTVVNVTIPDGATMQDLINLINRDSNNPGVVASAINDGSGGANPYHLMLSGEETGSGKDISINDATTDLNDGTYFDSGNWATTQTAQNAEIRVDGFPDPGWGWPNPWIESETNDVDDVIPGVTLHLQDDSGGRIVTIEVSLDKTAIIDKVNNLVNSYNDVIETINTLTRYDEENETSAPLFGDSLTRSIKDELLMMIAQNIPGTDDNDAYRILGQVGISLRSGGKLTIDEDELEEALDDDPTAVARLFVFDAESTSNFVTVTGHNENSGGGSYNFTLYYDANGVIDPNQNNTLNGSPVTVHGDSLVEGADDTDVEGLLLMLTDPGNGPSSISGTVKAYTGLSVLLANCIDRLTDSYEGSIKTNRDQINDSIDLLDERIEAWEDRLDLIEENYRRKYTQMEILIGQLQTTGNYLSSI